MVTKAYNSEYEKILLAVRIVAGVADPYDYWKDVLTKIPPNFAKGENESSQHCRKRISNLVREEACVILARRLDSVHLHFD